MTNQTASESKLEQTAARLRCIECGALCESAAPNFRCPGCGDLLEIFYPGWGSTGLSAAGLKALWRQRRTSRLAVDESGVWRFREVLPSLRDWHHAITLREGNTPVYELPSCARIAGVERLQAKHQGMNPTGSFKDTGMTVAASVAREEGFRWVGCASTGNTSASMAAYAARGGMRSLVLIPEGKISWGKLSQALDYGAVTCQLKTDFDGCLRVLNQAVQRAPVYLLNSVNPYRLEGQKTAAIELLEQLDWQVPDHVIVPGGNLGNSSALGKAFLEMKELGLVSRLPKISIIQAEGANPLVQCIREHGGKKLVPVRAETMATAIRIGNPASWKKAVRVLQTTGGTVEEVSEVEIALAKAEIGADGLGCEPASAVTLAGLKRLVKQGFVKPAESIVLILTGHLLKDPEFTLKFHRGDLFAQTGDEKEVTTAAPQQRPPIALEASVDAVLATLEKAEKAGWNT
ncbi:MAG TPA: threonine synthase [Terriglobales bacterium]|jgi:threonine synthase|nr:threonine synthase [Terriglobales bacterium]